VTPADVVGCIACDLTHGRRALPGGVIVESSRWRVEHCVGPLGVGTLLVKPLRHVESVGLLSSDEAEELGPLLTRVSDVVSRLCRPEQVYVCLWSHAGRQAGHVHFVVQPATSSTISEHGDVHGPTLQMEMFRRDVAPDADAVEALAAAARELMRPSVYEFAGGADAWLRLARAHHERCIADPMLNHPFSHPDQHPQHVERLAAYWGEVFGGPPVYSETCGNQSDLVAMHSGNGDMGDLPGRFVECFVRAADDAELPEDADFRTVLRDYMVWAVGEFVAHPDDPSTVPHGLSVPHWSWDGPH
jgi:hemoglobin